MSSTMTINPVGHSIPPNTSHVSSLFRLLPLISLKDRKCLVRCAAIDVFFRFSSVPFNVMTSLSFP